MEEAHRRMVPGRNGGKLVRGRPHWLCECQETQISK
jgi:hypothetical protein